MKYMLRLLMGASLAGSAVLAGGAAHADTGSSGAPEPAWLGGPAPVFQIPEWVTEQIRARVWVPPAEVRRFDPAQGYVPGPEVMWTPESTQSVPVGPERVPMRTLTPATAPATVPAAAPASAARVASKPVAKAAPGTKAVPSRRVAKKAVPSKPVTKKAVAKKAVAKKAVAKKAVAKKGVAKRPVPSRPAAKKAVAAKAGARTVAKIAHGR